VAYSACGNFALSEDVAQEAFWSAWRQRASIAEPERLGAWLCGIARNLGHNARRRLSRGAVPTAPMESAASVPDYSPGPAEVAVSREEEALVWQALETIPETYREPLILFYREQQSVSEVGAALELSADAVKQRLSRGRGMLQKRVAQLVEGALGRSRPGGSFTVTVLAGLATLGASGKSALAAGGAAPAAGALLSAGMGLANGLVGSVSGSLGGLIGSWLGSSWLPAQIAPTKAESQYLRRRGRRVSIVSVLFTGLVGIIVYAWCVRFIALPAFLISLGAWFAALWGYVGVELFVSARALEQIRGEATGAERNEAPLRRWLEGYRGRVFRSRACFLGIPLLDLNVADPAPPGRHAERRAARGWIAIGDDAYGVLFAMGGRAYGLIALGGRVAVGLIALGGIALGGLAVGGVGAGILAVGGLAFGWQACGGLAIGWDAACGGAALAQHAAYGGAAMAQDYAFGGAAWAGHCNDELAKKVIFDKPMAAAFDRSVSSYVWLMILLLLELLLVLCIVPLLRLMYWREPSQPPSNAV